MVEFNLPYDVLNLKVNHLKLKAIQLTETSYIEGYIIHIVTDALWANSEKVSVLELAENKHFRYIRSFNLSFLSIPMTGGLYGKLVSIKKDYPAGCEWSLVIGGKEFNHYYGLSEKDYGELWFLTTNSNS